MTNRYQIQARGNDRAELLIYGDIGEDWFAEESNDAKTVISKLADMPKSAIDVRINSYGGTVSDGLAIYNALKRHPTTVDVHVDGVAFSIASLIAMGGDSINMASNALMMVHAPWGMSVGNAQDMREMADSLDKYAGAMTAICATVGRIAIPCRAGCPMAKTTISVPTKLQNWASSTTSQNQSTSRQHCADAIDSNRKRQRLPQNQPWGRSWLKRTTRAALTRPMAASMSPPFPIPASATLTKVLRLA